MTRRHSSSSVDRRARRRARRRRGPGPRSSLRSDDALLSLRSSSRWNCHSPSQPGGVGQQHDDEREQQPPPAEQEPQRPHAVEVSPAPGVARHRPEGRRLDCGGDDTRLEDRFGRVATDLRVSLTDRCNLRCTYCMPAEGLDWLPDERAHRRRGGPAGRGSASSSSGSRRCGSPVASRWCAAAWSTSSAARTRSTAPRDLADHQRARPGPHGARAGRRRARPGQRQPRHASGPRRSTTITRRDRLARRDRRARPRARAGLGPVKVNAVLMRGVNDDQAPELLRWAWPRATSCGSSSRCRSTPSTAGRATGWSPPTRSSRARARVRARARRGAAGQRPGGAVPGRRRPGHRRRHRLGDPALLRRLRPGPADGRRPGAQLPLRPRGVRPAGRAARGRDRRRRSPSAGSSRCGASAPATASTTRSFLQPDRPMSAIGG